MFEGVHCGGIHNRLAIRGRKAQIKGSYYCAGFLVNIATRNINTRFKDPMINGKACNALHVASFTLRTLRIQLWCSKLRLLPQNSGYCLKVVSSKLQLFSSKDTARSSDPKDRSLTTHSRPLTSCHPTLPETCQRTPSYTLRERCRFCAPTGY